MVSPRDRRSAPPRARATSHNGRSPFVGASRLSNPMMSSPFSSSVCTSSPAVAQSPLFRAPPHCCRGHPERPSWPSRYARRPASARTSRARSQPGRAAARSRREGRPPPRRSSRPRPLDPQARACTPPAWRGMPYGRRSPLLRLLLRGPFFVVRPRCDFPSLSMPWASPSVSTCLPRLAGSTNRLRANGF